MRHTLFVCQSCGFESPKWLGRCPSCGNWGSMVEEPVVRRPRERAPRGSGATPLSELSLSPKPRRPTQIPELDRVLGGGVVPGSLILIGGDPGIGKSTITLQISAQLAQEGSPILYVSGEESSAQIRLRAERLGIGSPHILILAETELEEILAQAEKVRPRYLVIDSIQTVYRSDLSSAPGSVSQVRECAGELLRFAKEHEVSTFLVGHVTKFGSIAGPKTLEHMVDTVLYFEGNQFHQYRILRAAKNRFGSTNEIGIFEMTEKGLLGVENPSQLFLSSRADLVPGSAVVPMIEGSRPILVEIQALATPTVYSLPQRVATGFDLRRLSMLLCVLERRGGVSISHHDVYLNVVGGLRIEEPAADLGVVLAVASSAREVPIDPGLVVMGEVGLGGEIRRVARTELRVKEAQRLGFNRVMAPPDSLKGAEFLEVRSVREALKILGG